MSSKRFTFRNEDWEIDIIDNQTDRGYNLQGNENAEEVITLLNQLNDDNIQLKSLLKDAQDEIETLKKSNQQLMGSLVEKDSEN